MTRKIKITNTLYPDSAPNGTIMTITGWEPNGCVTAVKDGDTFPWFIDAGTFHVLDDTPTLWRDMTDAEKGALLLAKHKGEVIERHLSGDTWVSYQSSLHSDFAYREKPEPVRETVMMRVFQSGNGWCADQVCRKPSHKITFDTVDGVPVCDTIRMDPVS